MRHESSQTDFGADKDKEQAALAFLQRCFPDVDSEYLQHFLVVNENNLDDTVCDLMDAGLEYKEPDVTATISQPSLTSSHAAASEYGTNMASASITVDEPLAEGATNDNSILPRSPQSLYDTCLSSLANHPRSDDVAHYLATKQKRADDIEAFQRRNLAAAPSRVAETVAPLDENEARSGGGGDDRDSWYEGCIVVYSSGLRSPRSLYEICIQMTRGHDLSDSLFTALARREWQRVEMINDWRVSRMTQTGADGSSSTLETQGRLLSRPLTPTVVTTDAPAAADDIPTAASADDDAAALDAAESLDAMLTLTPELGRQLIALFGQPAPDVAPPGRSCLWSTKIYMTLYIIVLSIDLESAKHFMPMCIVILYHNTSTCTATYCLEYCVYSYLWNSQCFARAFGRLRAEAPVAERDAALSRGAAPSLGDDAATDAGAAASHAPPQLQTR